MTNKIWVHRATIKGEGSFPVDMLRYDSCFPSNYETVEILKRIYLTGPWTAEVQKLSRSASDGFNVDRWKGCGVKIQVKAPIRI